MVGSPIATRIKAFVKAVKTSLSEVQELEDLADSIDSDFTREKDRIKKLNSGSEKDEKDSHNKTRAKRAPQRSPSKAKIGRLWPRIVACK